MLSAAGSDGQQWPSCPRSVLLRAPVRENSRGVLKTRFVLFLKKIITAVVSAFCLISYCILYICIPIALVISQNQIFLFSNSGTQAWMALCPHPPSSKYLCPSWDVLFSEVIVWESDDFIGHLFKESFHIYSATPDLEFSNQSHILSCSATLPNESPLVWAST